MVEGVIDIFALLFVFGLIFGVLFLAYVVNMYADKREIKQKVAQEEKQNIHCPNCGRLIKNYYTFCKYCGYKLEK